MSNSPPEHSSAPATLARIVRLEERLTHTENLLDELNAVVCSIQTRLDRQERLLERLSTSAERLLAQNVEKRTLEDDRPPHY